MPRDLASTSPRIRLAVLASLYLSQGLPFGFFTQALPVMLRERGMSRSDIGLTSLLAIPWALKFVWAPIVDRNWSARLGRRTSWILPLQLGAIAVLSVLAVGFDTIPAMMVAVLVLNLVAATQDIATDGLAVATLAPSQRGLGNGLQVAAYRGGMIVGGGVLLVFYDRIGAGATYGIMALLLAFAIAPLLVVREPRGSAATERPPLALTFFRRPEAAAILGVIVVYRLADSMAQGMLRPFLSDAGLRAGDIGLVLGTAGFVASLVGAMVGGALVNRLGRLRSLLVFGLLQALAVASYAYLALGSPTVVELYVACSGEHFVGGMATAALFTCMMDWSRAETGATDYTIQASAVVIATGAASLVSGFVADAIGYAAHFGLASGLSLLSLVCVARLFPRTSTAAADIRVPT